MKITFEALPFFFFFNIPLEMLFVEDLSFPILRNMFLFWPGVMRIRES